MIQILVSINFPTIIIKADFKFVSNTDVWSDCMRFEYMYGSRRYVRAIFEASLTSVNPNLKSSMTAEYEKLKEEFKCVLII